MKHFYKLGFITLGLILVGGGCMSSSSSTVDGSVWQTEDRGATWFQMTALPQATGISSISNVNVNTLEIDPSDDSAYYIGTEQNGLLYSLDYGQTWARPEDAEASSGAVRSIEVDQNNRCRVFALKSNKLIKTGNCSRTYEVLYNEGRPDEQLTVMALDWFNTDSLWIGTTAGEVLHSIDGGKSWSTIYRVKDEVTDIMVSNHDSRVVLVATEDKGLFRTADGGATWHEFERELRSEYESSDRIYALTQDRRAETMLMASKFGILASYDQGETWQEISIITPSGDQKIWDVALNPENPKDIYYAAMGTMYMSQNGGQSWETTQLPSVRAPKVVQVHPTKTDRVFIGFASLEK